MSTIAAHLAALSDTRVYGYGIRIDPRAVTLLNWDLFHNVLHLDRSVPCGLSRRSWAISNRLSSCTNLCYHFFYRILSSWRHWVLGLYLPNSRHSCVFFSGLPGLRTVDDSRVSLAPSPKFLAKNEREDRRSQLVMVPSWRPQGVSHPLCPAATLKRYVDATEEAPPQSFFYSREGKQLTSRK